MRRSICSLVFHKAHSFDFLHSTSNFSALANRFSPRTPCHQLFSTHHHGDKEVANPRAIKFTNLLRDHENDFPSALKIYRKALQEGAVDSFFFSKAIGIACSAGDVTTAEQMFRELIDLGIRPDDFIFSSLFHMYMKQRNVPQAIECVRMCIRCGIHPQLSWVSTLFLNLFQNGFVEDARNLAQEFMERGVEFDQSVWGTLIVGFADSNRPIISLFFLRQATSAPTGGATAEISWLSKLLASFARLGEINECLDLLDQFPTFDIQLDVRIFVDLVNGLQQSGRLETVELFLDRMGALGVTPDPTFLSNLVTTFSKSGRLDLAQGVMELMRAFGYSLTAKTWTPYISGLAKKGDMKSAEHALLEMEKEGVQPNQHTYAALAEGYISCRSWESAVHTFEKMSEKGIKHNLTTYNICLKAFVHNHNPTKTVQFLENMRADGIEPDEISYHTILGYYLKGQRKRPKNALLMVQDMVNRGLVPQQFFIDCLRPIFENTPEWASFFNAYSALVAKRRK